MRTKITVGLVVAVPVVLHLLYALWASPLAAYYVTVGELHEREAPVGPVRVGGGVLAGSITWDDSRGELGFTLHDGTRNLRVIYRGPAPDSFRAGVTAIVEGRLDDDGRLLAERLLLKCPHEYVAG